MMKYIFVLIVYASLGSAGILFAGFYTAVYRLPPLPIMIGTIVPFLLEYLRSRGIFEKINRMQESR